MLRRFRSYLALRINQRGFHESFKAHKKIGKGNFASVYLADRLEDQRAFAIKAFSKEVAYGQDKGKVRLMQYSRKLSRTKSN
jgi:calcium-dependent protein kinase